MTSFPSTAAPSANYPTLIVAQAEAQPLSDSADSTNRCESLSPLQRAKAIELGCSLIERFRAKGDLARAVHALNLTRILSTRSNA